MKEEKDSIAVSAVIPVYNAEKYLDKCLSSILKQTLRNIEVICVNDGSTDKSLDKLKEFERRDERVKIINQNNINAGAARNKGFELVSGKYVVFLDADDFYEKKMLEAMYKRAELVRADVVVVNSDVYLDDEKRFIRGWPFVQERIPKEKVFTGVDVEQLFSTFVGWPWDKLFLTDFIKENKLKFQEQRSTNDLYFVYAALVRARRISVIDEILAHHRTGLPSSISATREKSWRCAYSALEKLKKQLENWNIYCGKIKRDYINYSLNFLLWHLDTLKYPAQKEFYDTLRTKWTKIHDSMDQKKDYFWNDNELRRMKKIEKEEYAEFLIGIMENLRNEISGLNDCLYDKNQYIEEMEKKNSCLEKKIFELQEEINAINGSEVLKVGKAVTYLPRKIKSIITSKN